MILTETPRRKLVTKLVSWGHWFALLNILIAIIIASVYVFTSPLPGTMLGTFFLFTNWLSHIGFLTFVGFIILILPLCYLIPNAKLVKACSSAISAVGLALLAFDALLYNKYGLHLSFSSAEFIRSEARVVIADFGWQQWGFLLLLFFVWLSFQLIIANALWQRIERFQKYHLGMPISSFFVACFVASHAVHVWADANLYQPIVQQDDMFPLSYPATAKTLMSKYGLLDLQNYRQRKELQYDNRVTQINYPLNPVYCAVNTTRPIALLLQVDGSPAEALKDSGLNVYESHYDLAGSDRNAILTTLFGLPEIYLAALDKQTPLLLDLPANLNLPVSVYSDTVINHSAIAGFTRDWQSFSSEADNTNAKLLIGFVTASQLDEMLGKNLTQHYDVLISSLSQDRTTLNPQTLFSNMSLNQELSSNTDIAPTIVRAMGCNAGIASYSTGRDLANPRQNWLVGTRGDTVIVLHNGQRIEVQSNGNYKIYDRVTGEENHDSLNTGLLSQAMKHLSRFAR